MKKFVLILLLLFATLNLFAQNSIFWKISGNGLKRSSYLTGTVHIISKKDFIWTKSMQQGLSKSKAICFELPMDKLVDKASLKYSMLLKGKSLKDYFTKNQYDSLNSYFDSSLHVPISTLNNYKPFTLLSLLMYFNAGYGAETTACETEIMNRGKEQKKSLEGLETIEQQMSYIDHQNQDSIVGSIMRIIHDPSTFKTTYNNTIVLYRKQDLLNLYKLIDSENMDGLSKTDLVDNRNKDWIPKMKKMMRKEPTFFAVGAGHLGGENGVISLLKKQGYRLTPIY